MHIQDGDLVMGMHDLDHVLGDLNHLGDHLKQPRFGGMPASDGFLEILDDSGELGMSGIDTDWNKPIREQLADLGVKRIVIRLDQVMTGGPGIDLGVHRAV